MPSRLFRPRRARNSNVPVPAIAKAIAAPLRSERPGYLISIRTPSLRSIDQPVSQRKDRSSR